MSAYSGTLFKEIYLFPVLGSPKCLRSTVYVRIQPLSLAWSFSLTFPRASESKRGGHLEIALAPGQERKLRCPAARVLLGGYRFVASVSTAFLWSTVYGLRGYAKSS